MKWIDLRGDTVTQPTPEMRAAIAAAEVGDDVMEEDPTVNRLQEMGAHRMGKEAGLFVASGTMGNLVAILTHCQRGDEAIMGNIGHTFLFEAGGAAALGGVQPLTLANQPDGTLLIEDIRSAIRAEDVHFPTTRLIILENTHNRCGGVPLTPDYTQQVGRVARENGLRLHLDGARIFNAAVALGVSEEELAAPADTVSFCLSKGLCAPVGSILCGTADFIKRARRIRKQLGGGMRQAGVLAAAGIIALERMTGRLGEDHARAAGLSDGLKLVPGLQLDADHPATNMVFAHLNEDVPFSAQEIADRLFNEFQIRVGVVGSRRFRMVTHYWIGDEDIQKTIEAFKGVLG